MHGNICLEHNQVGYKVCAEPALYTFNLKIINGKTGHCKQAILELAMR